MNDSKAKLYSQKRKLRLLACANFELSMWLLLHHYNPLKIRLNCASKTRKLLKVVSKGWSLSKYFKWNLWAFYTVDVYLWCEFNRMGTSRELIFAEMKFRLFRKFWSISRKLVLSKIISCQFAEFAKCNSHKNLKFESRNSSPRLAL